ncbi:MMPL family transporter [Pseudosporangium ferrugineum]|uniref:RND superfamily putative drug exporter n=1 Tax=Pseudosporangium ferrugineum TaxID=439699 RepID=A0A2T0SFA3_9ACTN|nr:MMPL family transporter [Pseudosporangium ferrugineum]PRY32089.1 RND superfamily putative drug exporter [Pseudosporangium ferrugineum]
MSAIARWCFAHRRTVLGLWTALLIALGVGYAAAGSTYSDDFSLPGMESTRALELLEDALPESSGDTEQIVVHVDRGTVRDPAVRARITAMLARVEQIPSVTSVASMYAEQGAGQISADGRTAYAEVQMNALPPDLPPADVDKVISTAEAARGPGLRVELSGPAIENATEPAQGSTELIGIIAAGIVLLLFFRSLIGMLLPLVVAIAGLGGGLMTIGLLSHPITLSDIAPTLAALIGLGVGIDYALFIVTRYRGGLRAGLSPEEATVRAINTSGRAVLFAGGTVIIALLGLLVLRLNLLTGMGVGAAVVVLFTLLSALTLLPAMLGFAGTRVLRRAERRARAAGTPRPESASGARWAALVQRRRAVLGAVALIVIAVLAIPAFSVRLGASDAGNDQAGTTTRAAYDLLADGFGPGFNGPLQLVAELGSAADGRALEQLLEKVKTVDGVAAVAALPAEPGAKVAVAMVIPTTAPQDAGTTELIDRLREEVIPAAENGTSLRVYVGGATAIFQDFATVLSDKLPLFLVVVIALGFLLLTVAFRSVLVPLTAAVMNVLAAAASFGVIVAIFQWGWGSSLLDLGGPGPVESFVPVIMLAILFGLSMDYQVFLVSRMHEEWERTRDNGRSVSIGQRETGRVIVAAALIMIFVFGAFVLGGERVISEFGIGLAAAVAIDAFLIRSILVPALMHLFGRANWWLPHPLDRALPHFSVEGDQDGPGEAGGTATTPAGPGGELADASR